MSALAQYLENRNVINFLLKSPPIEMPTTSDACRPLFRLVEGELSPENLHCDGECSAQEAQRKSVFLNQVWSELEDIGGVSVEQRI